jgi:hypothetical protein
MPGFCQCDHQLLASMFGVASLGVMEQGDAHAIYRHQYQAKLNLPHVSFV